jgi:DNA polymerase
MNRQEAMLRELNLYPCWVRRTEPDKPAVETCTEIDNEHETSSVMASTGDAQHCDLVPPRDENNTLLAFQLQHAGGALGRLNWTELEQKVRTCQLCPLNSTQTVFGSGNRQAHWLFAGEAPGTDEAASGEPFTGHAGRLLTNMLLAIHLKRNDVYITNVLKCRPTGDRPPHTGEIDACLPYLRRQIDLVQPRLIIALGKTAATALLGKEASIASLRGKVHQYKNIPLIVTYHPAFLLRSPMEKARAWQDMCLAVETMHTINAAKPV